MLQIPNFRAYCGLSPILLPRRYEEIKKQFVSLINKKNTSEYQPDLMDEGDAHEAIKWAERILTKVKAKLNP